MQSLHESVKVRILYAKGRQRDRKIQCVAEETAQTRDAIKRDTFFLLIAHEAHILCRGLDPEHSHGELCDLVWVMFCHISQVCGEHHSKPRSVCDIVKR